MQTIDLPDIQPTDVFCFSQCTIIYKSEHTYLRGDKNSPAATVLTIYYHLTLGHFTVLISCPITKGI